MTQRQSSRDRSDATRPLVGAQLSTAGGFTPVPGRARALAAEVVQIFPSNPRMWRPRVPAADELQALVTGLAEHRLPLFFHTIYLINLATPDKELRRRSAEALTHSLVLGAQAGVAGVVTHVGSHRGEGIDKGLPWAAQAIREATIAAGNAIGDRGDGHTLPPLLLESGTGGGNTLGGRLEELAGLLEELDGQAGGQAFGICIDTAHLFAAGYPVHEADGLESVIEELRSLALLPAVGLVHLNDSAAPFGSAWDKHENPGDGRIGYASLARVVRHPALAHIPFVLETPGLDGHGPDVANMAMVKAMRAGKLAGAARRAAIAAQRPGEAKKGGTAR